MVQIFLWHRKTRRWVPTGSIAPSKEALAIEARAWMSLGYATIEYRPVAAAQTAKP